MFLKYVVVYSFIHFLDDSKEKIDSSESFPKKGNNLDYKDRSMVLIFGCSKSIFFYGISLTMNDQLIIKITFFRK